MNATKPLVLAGCLAAGAMNAHAKIPFDLKISGFATAAISFSDTDYETDASITKEASYKADSVVGLQFDSQVTKYTAFTLQLIARGDSSHAINGKSDFEPDIEWAFLTLTPADGHDFKIGRLRNPVFLLSETLEVGVTYPWVRPPQDMYGRVISTQFEGISYEFSHLVDDWNIRLNPFWGAAYETEGIKVDAQYGLNFTLNNDEHTFRVGYSGAKIHISSAYDAFYNIIHGFGPNKEGGANFANDLTTSDGATIAGILGANNGLISTEQTQALLDDTLNDINYNVVSLGYMYEGEHVFVMTELNQLVTEGSDLIEDNHSGYITIGGNIGKWQPHLTWAFAQTTNDDEREDLASELASLYGGVRTRDEIKDQGLDFLIQELDNVGACNDSSSPMGLWSGMPFALMPAGSCLWDPTVAIQQYATSQTNQRESITAGVKWNYDERSAFKFDVQYIYNFDDTHGFFGNNTTGEGTRDLDDDEVFIYRLAFTTTF